MYACEKNVKQFKFELQFDAHLSDIQANGKMLIHQFNPVPKSLPQVKLVSPKREGETFHWETINVHSFYYIKDDNIDDIICSLSLKQVLEIESKSKYNLLYKAIMKIISNESKEKEPSKTLKMTN